MWILSSAITSYLAQLNLTYVIRYAWRRVKRIKASKSAPNEFFQWQQSSYCARPLLWWQDSCECVQISAWVTNPSSQSTLLESYVCRRNCLALHTANSMCRTVSVPLTGINALVVHLSLWLCLITMLSESSVRAVFIANFLLASSSHDCQPDISFLICKCKFIFNILVLTGPAGNTSFIFRGYYGW